MYFSILFIFIPLKTFNVQDDDILPPIPANVQDDNRPPQIPANIQDDVIPANVQDDVIPPLIPAKTNKTSNTTKQISTDKEITRRLTSLSISTSEVEPIVKVIIKV